MNFKSVYSVIKKNFKILWRSKISAIAIVFVPLIVVLLVGIGFSTFSFSSINAGVYSYDYNNLTQSSLDVIEEKGYVLDKYPSKTDCEKSVKDGKTDICVIFPKNLSIKTNESISIYVDKSETDLAYYLINTIQTQIAKKSQGISETQVQKLIDLVTNAKGTVSSVKEQVSSMKNDIDSAKDSASIISSENTDIDELMDKLQEINSSLEDFGGDNESDVGEIISTLEEAKEKTENINNSLNRASFNSEKILNDLNNLENKVNKISNELDGLSDKLNSREIVDVKKIVKPINTEIKSINPNSSNWDYIFPNFLTIVVLFCSIILASSLVMREKKAGAYFRNSITSTPDFAFIIGTYITCLIILFLQLIIVLTGVHFIIGTSLNTIVGELALAVIFSSSIFIFLGMLISYAFKSEETTMVVSISVVALFLFFSNVIFPIEAISGPLQKIIEYNPAAVSNSLFRKIVLFKYSAVSILKGFLSLFLTFISFVVLTVLVKKMSKKRI